MKSGCFIQDNTIEQDLNMIKSSKIAFWLTLKDLRKTLRTHTVCVKPIPACVLETKGKRKEICADKMSSSVWSRCSVPERYWGLGWGGVVGVSQGRVGTLWNSTNVHDDPPKHIEIVAFWKGEASKCHISENLDLQKKNWYMQSLGLLM